MEVVFFRTIPTIPGKNNRPVKQNLFNECLEQITQIRAEQKGHMSECSEMIQRLERRTDNFKFNQDNFI